MNILHPIKSIEEWALGRLSKRVAEQLPIARAKLQEIWKAHQDEIIEKVGEAIKNTIIEISQEVVNNTQA